MQGADVSTHTREISDPRLKYLDLFRGKRTPDLCDPHNLKLNLPPVGPARYGSCVRACRVGFE